MCILNFPPWGNLVVLRGQGKQILATIEAILQFFPPFLSSVMQSKQKPTDYTSAAHKRRERSVYVQDSSEMDFENARSQAPFAGAEPCGTGWVFLHTQKCVIKASQERRAALRFCLNGSNCPWRTGGFVSTCNNMMETRRTVVAIKPLNLGEGYTDSQGGRGLPVSLWRRTRVSDIL